MCEEAIPLLDTAAHDDIEVLEETTCALRDDYAVSDLIFSLNENDDIQTVLLQTKKHRPELCARGPILPEGKEAHLFVSNSSNDSDEVLTIVADLERIGLGCILADRDFDPGKKVLDNIENGMEKSAKVLLFMSSNFLRSEYCTHELGMAFLMSLENSKDFILPVLLGECEVPRKFKTLTYIDATKEKQRLSHRIMEAFKNLDDVLPLHFDQERKKLENGFYVEVECKADTCCYGRPAEVIVNIDETVVKQIHESKIEISRELLQTVADLINEHHKNHFWSKVDSGCCAFCSCCFSLVFFLSVGFVVAFVVLLQLADVREPSQRAIDINLSTKNVWWVVLLAVFVGISTCGFRCYFGTQARRKLDEKLFDRITTSTYKDNVLFSMCDHKAKKQEIYLRIIRYNVKLCETHLAERIRKNADQHNQEVSIHANAEAKAKQMILSYLRTFLSSTYQGSIISLPDAPENRHNVKGGKKCFCQILEDAVPLTESVDIEVI